MLLYFLYLYIQFGTILATAHSVTDRFSPGVWYYPEDCVINSKIFLGPDLIEKSICVVLIFQ